MVRVCVYMHITWYPVMSVSVLANEMSARGSGKTRKLSTVAMVVITVEGGGQ